MKKVIIVGGGIVGAACAYELIRKNIDVTIIDAHKKGRATSAAAGVICPWLTQRRNKAWFHLAREGALYYDTLISALAKDGETNTGYKKVGLIRLAEQNEALEPFVQIGKERRIQTPQIGEINILSPEKTKELFPYIEKDFYALYVEHAARVDGRLLRDSLISASIKHGATLIEGHATLMRHGKKFIGVQVGTKEILADDIIVVNGAWMKEIFAEADISVDVRPQKGQIIDLYDEGNTNNLPVVKPPNNQYLLTFDDGKIVVGATQENTDNLQPTSTAFGVHYILEQALTYAPQLASSHVNEIRVGFRPTTFNHAPMYGPIPNYENIYIGTGLGASGLNTGPYMGMQLAKMALGEPLDLNAENYKVDDIICEKA